MQAYASPNLGCWQSAAPNKAHAADGAAYPGLRKIPDRLVVRYIDKAPEVFPGEVCVCHCRAEICVPHRFFDVNGILPFG